MTQLARIEQLPYEMLNKASPTIFGDIKNMTLWRGIVFLLSECSTFLELHSLRFDDTSNTYLAPTRNPVGNILNAINDLAGSVDAAMQMNAAGQGEVIRDARMLHYDADDPDERDDLVTVANWITSDLLEIELEHAHVRTVGRLKATGGSYNSTSNLYADYESLAPGVAQDYGDGTAQLDRQVLTANSTAAAAKSELNERAGHALERAQEVDQVRALFPDGYYGVLIAALDQWHTFDVDDDDIDVHLDPSDRWLLTEVTINFDTANESIEVRGTFIKETIGSPGQTVTYPAGSEVPLVEPTFPPFDPYPPFPIDIIDLIGTDPVIDPIVFEDQVPKDGNAIITGTADQCLVVVNFKRSNTPGVRDVTPIALFGTVRDGKRGKLKDFYLLCSDEEDSQVFYTEDIFAGEVLWSASEIISGVYTQLRTTETAGEVYILSLGGSTVTEEWLGGEGPGAWTIIPFGAGSGCVLTVMGTYNSGDDRFEGTYCVDGEGKFVRVLLDLGVPSTIVSVEMDVDYEATLVTGSTFFAAGISFDGANVASSPQGSPSSSVFTLAYNVLTHGVTEIDLLTTAFTNVGDGHTYITGIRITYISGGEVQTRFSDDFASLFASSEVVGDAPGPFAGFDTQKVGDAVVVGTDGQTEIATTAGGSYSAYGTTVPTGAQPSALFIPRYIFTSTSSGNESGTPEYLLFSDILASGESMWRVTAGGNTFFDITPIRSGTEGLAVGYRCVEMPWRSGAIILAVAEFGGAVRRLCVTLTSGSSWVFSEVLADGALAVTTRKSDASKREAYIANGSRLGYCADYQAATPLITEKNIGVEEDLLFVEVYE